MVQDSTPVYLGLQKQSLMYDAPGAGVIETIITFYVSNLSLVLAGSARQAVVLLGVKSITSMADAIGNSLGSYQSMTRSRWTCLAFAKRPVVVRIVRT